MNALIAVILGALTVYLTYTRYARRIDRNVIQSDPKRATPATLYMDGVDFMPTNRNILFGYHFKSIAAAGPIVGAIVAATLWGWLPAMLWLIGGVAFMGWVSDYSAIVMSVRNEGTAFRRGPSAGFARTRTILFFLSFYLLLVAGAFVGIMRRSWNPAADAYGNDSARRYGFAGQMLYRWHVVWCRRP
jgi:carbon starvation protein